MQFVPTQVSTNHLRNGFARQKRSLTVSSRTNQMSSAVSNFFCVQKPLNHMTAHFYQTSKKKQFRTNYVSGSIPFKLTSRSTYDSKLKNISPAHGGKAKVSLTVLACIHIRPTCSSCMHYGLYHNNYLFLSVVAKPYGSDLVKLNNPKKT